MNLNKKSWYLCYSTTSLVFPHRSMESDNSVEAELDLGSFSQVVHLESYVFKLNSFNFLIYFFQ